MKQRSQTIAALCTLCPVVLVGAVATFRTEDTLEDKSIRYMASTPTDSITRLQQRLESGEAHLYYTEKNGYLSSVLQELKISPLTQTLVFSKTSVQHPFISPRHPRALYFGDDVYIGWVDGGAFLEITTVDPKLGAVFYILEQQPGVAPRFMRRNDECLMCHSTRATRDVPGLVLRSMATQSDGSPNYSAGNYLTTDESPFSQRWGGWYVTGTHGKARHLGNQVVREEDTTLVPSPERGANVLSLSRFMDTRRYLTPHSDIVALLVMEHQATVQNRITKANYDVRRSLANGLSKPDGTLSPGARDACEALLRSLLFVGASPLPAPIKGSSGFTEAFQKRGPVDSQKRSLYQLDLKTRLLHYPCSYLIYSASFDALPSVGKQYIYQRLGAVLRGQGGPEYANLSAEDRTALREILRETKPELASYLSDAAETANTPVVTVH